MQSEPPARAEPAADQQTSTAAEPQAVWLTVKQFADAAGVSTQRIYQRLAKDLQSYCKEEKGTKYLDSAALALFGEQEDLQGLAKGLPSTYQVLTKGLQTPCKEECAAEKVALESKVDSLTAELLRTQKDLDAAREQRAAAERRAADRDTLKEQAQDLKAERERIAGKLLRCETDLKQAQETAAKAQSEAAAARAALDAVTTSGAEKAAEIDRLQVEIDAARDQREQLRADIARLESSLTAAQDRAERAEIALDAEKAQCTALTEQLAAIADKQADAIRAGAAEQLALAIPADQQPRKGFFARLFHREKKDQ